MSSSPELPPIVIAEDSPDDLFFLELELREAGIRNPVLTFQSGRKAVEYLEPIARGAPHAGARRPCLIFLDIKMPAMSGLEVLEWARREPALADIPIVMLSGSTADSDIDKARELGATDHLVKPATAATLSRFADRVQWSGPPGQRP